MNEWDRLHRMAEYYKAEYPSGTRIMLLSMGEDIRRIGDNTRGTVMAVDDKDPATKEESIMDGKQFKKMYDDRENP